MLDEVFCDEVQTLLRADQSFQSRPLRLQPLLPFDLFALGDLLELIVEVRLLLVLQFELREAALIVDGDCRTILDRLLDVINADVEAIS